MKAHTPDFDRDVYCLLGLPFDAVDIAGAAQSLRTAVSGRNRCFFSTPNLNFLVACLHDAHFRDSVIHSDLSVADGMPLIWIARLLGVPLPERVAGAGLFETMRADTGKAMRVYFFGGPAGAAAAAFERLNAMPGGMRCVGYESPGFGSVEQMSAEEIIARVNASGADFLVVSVGAVKGNAWIEHNLSRLTVPLVGNLGAVVNFVAGSVNRAPVSLQRAGLEWMWRIKEEPQLWRRYFFDGLAFARLLLTRVLPYAWYTRLHRYELADAANATVTVDMQAGTAYLKLQGAWTSRNLDPVRSTFKSVVRDCVDIKLDMAEVNHVDSALIGLLMVLFGHQQVVGKRLIVVSVAYSVRRIFKLNCAEFLLSDASERD